MRLSPIDILNRRFGRSIRGLSPSEVDDFMREIASDLEAIVAENAQLHRQVESLEREVAAHAAMGATIKDALVLAQRAADDARSAAQREADFIVQEARDRAEAVLTEGARDVEAARLQRQRFVAEFRGLLEAHLEHLTRLNLSGPTAQPHTDAPEASVNGS